jgi:hypothetical protein
MQRWGESKRRMFPVSLWVRLGPHSPPAPQYHRLSRLTVARRQRLALQQYERAMKRMLAYTPLPARVARYAQDEWGVHPVH